MPPYPDWLRILSWAYLSVSFVYAAIIIGDELRRPQKMMIMNFVWPITALYLGPAALWGYLKSGSKMAEHHRPQLQGEILAEPNALTREQVTLATTQCEAGCASGDIVSEWLVFAMGLTFAGGEFPPRLTLDLLLGVRDRVSVFHDRSHAGIVIRQGLASSNTCRHTCHYCF
jgi:hypothetical protein